MKLFNINIELLSKYNISGPRYTSYPTVPYWENNFSQRLYLQEIQSLKKNINQPISLYFHIPFCEKLCLYCGCYVIVDKLRRYVKQYLNYLKKELNLFYEHLGTKAKVIQIHWGGGTPTFLNEWEIEFLYRSIEEYFIIQEGAEIAIEADPCVTHQSQLKLLKEIGFNRLSFGVQDFNQDVQKLVKRNQSLQKTIQMVHYARELNYESINLDFIYGLPMQTVESFKKTINQVNNLNPDRVALFSYAKVPWLKPHQRLLEKKYLPSTEEKFKIFLMARKKFIEKGYVPIGMDHFAKKSDKLALAVKFKTLHRNFMGYTPQFTKNAVGFGVSSIGCINKSYVQNVKQLKVYYEAIDNNKMPIGKGICLNEDDLKRQWVIYHLMCHFEINYNKFENIFNKSFKLYFKSECLELEYFLNDELIKIMQDKILVLDKGIPFVRNIAMTFDLYLNNSNKQKQFSKTI